MKQVNVTEIKIGDIIVGEKYKLQCGRYRNGHEFEGLEWAVFDTELEVLRIRELDNGKIRLTVANTAHITTKTYNRKQMLKIK